MLASNLWLRWIKSGRWLRVKLAFEKTSVVIDLRHPFRAAFSNAAFLLSSGRRSDRIDLRMNAPEITVFEANRVFWVDV